MQRRGIGLLDEGGAPGSCGLLVVATRGIAGAEIDHRGVEIRGPAHGTPEGLRGRLELLLRQQRQPFQEGGDG